ncbi:antitoxin [Candidatus Gottesmanbacteria bacterium]|nr:antitoxin [Candidatus Gottesmanbacteria bacterium]
MKKQKSVTLDSYEKEINDAIERGKVREVSPAVLQRMREKYARIAKYTKTQSKKDRRVSLRMNERDLDAIQAKASANGLPYQTLIATILHQVATGKVTVTL